MRSYMHDHSLCIQDQVSFLLNFYLTFNFSNLPVVAGLGCAVKDMSTLRRTLDEPSGCGDMTNSCGDPSVTAKREPVDYYKSMLNTHNSVSWT